MSTGYKEDTMKKSQRYEREAPFFKDFKPGGNDRNTKTVMTQQGLIDSNTNGNVSSVSDSSEE